MCADVVVFVHIFNNVALRVCFKLSPKNTFLVCKQALQLYITESFLKALFFVEIYKKKKMEYIATYVCYIHTATILYVEGERQSKLVFI